MNDPAREDLVVRVGAPFRPGYLCTCGLASCA